MLTMKKRKQEVDKDINNACLQILIPKDTSYAVSTLKWTLYPSESSLNILQCLLPNSGLHRGTICILTCSPKVSSTLCTDLHWTESFAGEIRKSTAKELGDNMLYSHTALFILIFRKPMKLWEYPLFPM